MSTPVELSPAAIPEAARTAARVPRDHVGIILSVLGAALAVVALIVFWLLRAQAGRAVYVSELGADLAPGRSGFAIALGMVAIAGILLGVGRFTSEGRSALLIAGALVVAGLGFAIATAFPCTAGCPVPGTAAHTVRDTVHITAAIIGFVLVCVAMLVQAATGPERWERRVAMVCAIAVAVIAGAGGLLALAGWGTAVGATCEFIATTIAIIWCASLALRFRRRAGSEESVVSGRRRSRWKS